jgi:protein SCO1
MRFIGLAPNSVPHDRNYARARLLRSARLKEYLSSFDPRIRTGTGEQIAAVAKEYRVYYKRIQLEKGVYALPHAAVIYLMDRGKFVNQISLQTDDKIAIETLRQLAAL